MAVRALPSVLPDELGPLQFDDRGVARVLESFFELDSAALRADMEHRLVGLLPGLINHRGRVRIIGMTDGLGPTEHNLDLSRRRAQSVHAWILAHGVEPAKLLAPEGKGEAEAADNVADPGRRRVDIILEAM